MKAVCVFQETGRVRPVSGGEISENAREGYAGLGSSRTPHKRVDALFEKGPFVGGPRKPERSGARRSPTPAQMGARIFKLPPICCEGARPKAKSAKLDVRNTKIAPCNKITPFVQFVERRYSRFRWPKSLISPQVADIQYNSV